MITWYASPFLYSLKCTNTVPTQFFGLFGLCNRASSIIGPNVIQAIITHTNNNWSGFPFLFALCASAGLVIWFGVDVERGRRDAVLWAEEKRMGGARVGDVGSASGTRNVEELGSLGLRERGGRVSEDKEDPTKDA